MFKIKCQGLFILIPGCPKEGLAAVDFRREHKLPLAPDNYLEISKSEGTSEELCRQFAHVLDARADLNLIGPDAKEHDARDYPLEVLARLAEAHQAVLTRDERAQQPGCLSLYSARDRPDVWALFLRHFFRDKLPKEDPPWPA